jgi:hypothetical protein
MELRNWVRDQAGLVKQGLTVNLYDADTDALLDTTTTDADGMWEFTELSSATTYRVEVVDGLRKLCFDGRSKVQFAEADGLDLTDLATSADLATHEAAADPHTVYPLKSILTTRGDLVYRDATTWKRLGKGTTGQVLKQGANDPAWANADPTTQTQVTSHRALDTVYQNASIIKPLWVSVTISMVTPCTVAAAAQNTSPPTAAVGRCRFSQSIGTVLSQLFFIVLPGYYYSVIKSSGTASVEQWTEWQ